MASINTNNRDKVVSANGVQWKSARPINGAVPDITKVSLPYLEFVAREGLRKCPAGKANTEMCFCKGDLVKVVGPPKDNLQVIIVAKERLFRKPYSSLSPNTSAATEKVEVLSTEAMGTYKPTPSSKPVKCYKVSFRGHTIWLDENYARGPCNGRDASVSGGAGGAGGASGAAVVMPISDFTNSQEQGQIQSLTVQGDYLCIALSDGFARVLAQQPSQPGLSSSYPVNKVPQTTQVMPHALLFSSFSSFAAAAAPVPATTDVVAIATAVPPPPPPPPPLPSSSSSSSSVMMVPITAASMPPSGSGWDGNMTMVQQHFMPVCYDAFHG